MPVNLLDPEELEARYRIIEKHTFNVRGEQRIRWNNAWNEVNEWRQEHNMPPIAKKSFYYWWKAREGRRARWRKQEEATVASDDTPINGSLAGLVKQALEESERATERLRKVLVMIGGR